MEIIKDKNGEYRIELIIRDYHEMTDPVDRDEAIKIQEKNELELVVNDEDVICVLLYCIYRDVLTHDDRHSNIGKLIDKITERYC